MPWLIGLGSLAILLVRQPAGVPDEAGRYPWPVLLGVFAIGVYGGYFGAGAGVLLLALLLTATTDTLPRCNAVKNIVLGLANGAAAVIFVVDAQVAWRAVIFLGLGMLLGGRLGPVIVRHLPVRLLKLVIALAGLGLAAYLGLHST